MRALTFLGAAALALSVLSGCAATRSFSGTVAPADADRFAPDATVQVMLMDAASGSVVASQTYPVDGRHTAVPFRFSTSEQLAPNGHYELRARVISPTGSVLYQSNRGTPVTMPPSGELTVTVQPAS